LTNFLAYPVQSLELRRVHSALGAVARTTRPYQISRSAEIDFALGQISYLIAKTDWKYIVTRTRLGHRPYIDHFFSQQYYS
jgi:hypothetical protein